MPKSDRKPRSMKLLLVQPQQLGTIFKNIMEPDNNQFLNEVFSGIIQNIVYPIAAAPIEEIEDTFDRYITPFKIEFTNMLELLNKHQLMGKKLNEIDGSEYIELTGQFRKLVEQHSQIEPALRSVLGFVEALNAYDIILIENSERRPETLDDVLTNKIDLNDLQIYVLGSLMAYFCFLILLGVRKGVYVLTLPNELEVILSMVLSIGEKYNKSLLSYMKTIDVLCNRQRMNELRPLIHSNPKIAGIVGRTLVAELPADYKIKNRDKFIAIDYSNSTVVQADTLEQLHDKLNKKDLKRDFYIERLGHNYVTKLDL